MTRRKKRLKNKKLKHQNRSVWWAVDPLQDENEFHTHALQTLKPFATALRSQIVPVSYFNASKALQFSAGLLKWLPNAKKAENALVTMAQKRLSIIASGNKAKNLAKPIFLNSDLQNSPSLREKVSLLSLAAKKGGAKFIAMHSHGRKGIRRFYMGSFAETFMLYGNIPSLIINPGSPPSPRIKHILFPTDFSKESMAAFNFVVDLANELSAKLSIIHYFHIPSISIFHRNSVRKEYEDYIKRQDVQLLKRGASLEHRAKGKNVNSKFHLIREVGEFDPTAAILKFAKFNSVKLIALASQSSASKTYFIGATSRELVRNAECPVLIFRK